MQAACIQDYCLLEVAGLDVSHLILAAEKNAPVLFCDVRAHSDSTKAFLPSHRKSVAALTQLLTGA